MSRPIIERRSMTRPCSLEDHMQAAINAQRQGAHGALCDAAIDRVVADAHAAVLRLPEALRERARHAVSAAMAAPKPKQKRIKPRARGEALFAKTGRAA